MPIQQQKQQSERVIYPSKKSNTKYQMGANSSPVKKALKFHKAVIVIENSKPSKRDNTSKSKDFDRKLTLLSKSRDLDANPSSH